MNDSSLSAALRTSSISLGPETITSQRLKLATLKGRPLYCARSPISLESQERDTSPQTHLVVTLLHDVRSAEDPLNGAPVGQDRCRGANGRDVVQLVRGTRRTHVRHETSRVANTHLVFVGKEPSDAVDKRE